MVAHISKLTLAAVAFAKAFPFARAIDRSDCAPIELLGTNDVNRFDYSSSLDVDDQCAYSFSFRFKHDPSLPIPSEPSQCDPSVFPPALAPDYLPYFHNRWAYAAVPGHVKDATGIDHVSVDWNPCGHPPMDVFTVPHYDFHVYLVSPEYRRCMTCNTIPGTPVCDPENQSTPNGKGFFNVNTIVSGADAGKFSNMPDNFAFGDPIPFMGGHGWDVANQPNLTAGSPWVDPIWVMGPFDGTIVDYEPMVPLSFVSGLEDKYYEESLTYVGQTINELPTKYSVAFDAASGYATVSLEGKSAVCGTDCQQYTLEESFCGKPITSADACEEAARCLGKNYDLPVPLENQDKSHMAKGCFHKGTKLRFNDVGPYGTKCSSKKKCVCYL